ncbi:hypothetical protein [Natrarchaeobius oligotrophus]|uniref:hypothetical protein n=1 Tax=Natrarchaeobius oligotrophus TaxID=3455743 RepID=UPI0014045B16|nr:hypothetical protein [Natrarchaeobius chitinivorans]
MSCDDPLGTCPRCGRAIAISYTLSPTERYAWPCGCRQPVTDLERADGGGR